MDALRPLRLLLLLDNCEHLAEACAELVDAVTRDCPHVRVVATSREPLGCRGEAVWPVPPFGAPPATEAAVLSAVELLRYDAVRLFVDRATASLPTFALTERNAWAVADICRRLDGLPLAIELAAARVRGLAVELIATRLDDRFRLLTSGEPHRHAPAADAPGGRGLELRPARPAGADAVRPPLRVRRRLHPLGRRGGVRRRRSRRGQSGSSRGGLP